MMYNEHIVAWWDYLTLQALDKNDTVMALWYHGLWRQEYKWGVVGWR